MQKNMSTVIKTQNVHNMDQALVAAGQLLDGHTPQEVLASQLLAQNQTEARLKSLESLYLCQKDILNLDEAAEYLNISKSCLYKMTSKKEIPFYKPNRLVYFERRELDNWVRSAVVLTEEQLNDQVNTYTMSKKIPI